MARLFVSDVHLDAGAPQAIEQFLDFLKLHARDAEALYILGDLFETWVGDDDPDPQKARIAAALRELTAAGVAIFVIHGNRDFLSVRLSAPAPAASFARPVVVELDAERVLITHGDALCTDDHAYQALRSSVRAAAWQRRFLALPLSWPARISRSRRERQSDSYGERAATDHGVNAGGSKRRFMPYGAAHDSWPHPPPRHP